VVVVPISATWVRQGRSEWVTGQTTSRRPTLFLQRCNVTGMTLSTIRRRLHIRCPARSQQAIAQFRGSRQTDRIEAMLLQDRLSLLGQNEQRKTCGQRLVSQDDKAVGRSDGQRGWQGNVHEARYFLHDRH
jgi:hypothetical protein